jgi:hypothetical protein
MVQRRGRKKSVNYAAERDGWNCQHCNLQSISPATLLTFPAISLQNFETQLAVPLRIEPKTRVFGKCRAHSVSLSSCSSSRR